MKIVKCPWSGTCSLLGQQISLSPLSTAHAISLTTSTRTESPTASKLQYLQPIKSREMFSISSTCEEQVSDESTFTSCIKIKIDIYILNRGTLEQTTYVSITEAVWTGWWPGWKLALPFYHSLSRRPSTWWTWISIPFCIRQWLGCPWFLM